ncbi:hypothetical protein BASA81_000709 [Batrachochytrium salamandrivorans]|nr:hypothetical protein BASA81_000709 [Batrachochytrium salamandrivorans]
MEIALALQHPSNKLLRLALCECGVGDIGAMAMALTHACNRVRELDLSYNRVRDGGAKHLAKALIHPHNKLTRLELVGNGVTRQGGKAIAGAFRHVNCRVSRAGDFCANAKHALYDAIAFQRLLVLLSARQVRRIGKHSALKRLPVELIRLVSQTCRIAKRDGYDWTV